MQSLWRARTNTTPSSRTARARRRTRRSPISPWPRTLGRSKRARRLAATASRSTTSCCGSKRNWATKRRIQAGMRFRVLGASSLVVLGLVLAGCGSEESEEPSARPTTTTVETATVPEQAPAVVALYFLRDGKVGLARRSIVTGPQIGTAALKELLEGPSAADRAAGLTTDIPSGTTLERLAIEEGVARVELSSSLDE